MTTTPFYDALVAELAFDPATVSPIQQPYERQVAHQRWLKEAQTRVACGLVNYKPGATKPGATRPRVRKAAAKKAAS